MHLRSIVLFFPVLSPGDGTAQIPLLKRNENAHRYTSRSQVWCLMPHDVLFVGCRPSVPPSIYSHSELEDMLYDWHWPTLWLALGNDSPTSSNIMQPYSGEISWLYPSPLEVSVHYMRHERLKTIYEHLCRCFNDEACTRGRRRRKLLATGKPKGDGKMCGTAKPSMVFHKSPSTFIVSASKPTVFP